MAAKQTSAAQAVHRKLTDTWRRERRAAHLQGLAVTLMWLLALAVVDLVVDWLLKLPGYGRFGLLLLNLGTLGYIGYTRWYAKLHRFDPVHYALKVESQHPELASLLVSFVQFEGRAGDESVSPALIAAMKRRALAETEPLDFKRVIDLREMKRILLFGLGAILFFALISVNWSAHFRVLLIRLFNPLADASYPTRTRLESVTGNLTVKQGDHFVIKAEISGILPREGTLQVLPAGGKNWETVSMIPAESAADGTRATFVYEQSQAYRSFSYRVKIGDAESGRYQVKVIPPPTVVKAKVTQTPPPYTGRPAAVSDTLNLTDVCEGSEVKWELTMNYPLARAELLAEKGDSLPFRVAADGMTITLNWKPTDSTSYFLRYVRKDFGDYVYQDEVRYILQLLPDAPPRVEVLRPNRDQKATVKKRLKLTVRAEDDNLVQKVWVVYNVNEGDERQALLAEPAAKMVDANYTWDVRQAIPELQVGDVVGYRVMVADNYPGKDGAYHAASPTQRLFIVGIPEYLQWVFEEKDRMARTLQEVKRQEEESRRQVDELRRN